MDTMYIRSTVVETNKASMEYVWISMDTWIFYVILSKSVATLDMSATVGGGRVISQGCPRVEDRVSL